MFIDRAVLYAPCPLLTKEASAKQEEKIVALSISSRLCLTHNNEFNRLCRDPRTFMDSATKEAHCYINGQAPVATNSPMLIDPDTTTSFQAMTKITTCFLALTQLLCIAFPCAGPRRKHESTSLRLEPANECSTRFNQEDEDDDEEEDEDEDEDELLDFRPTIALINFEALKAYALQVRTQSCGMTDVQTRTNNQLTCDINEEPMCGSFNLAYVLHFGDGSCWIARFPVNSPNFGPLDKQKMDSEYHTMRYLRKDLQLALPDVFAWQTDSTVVGAPFALMSFVPGVSIMNRWLDKEWITEDKKMKILSNLAQYMAILQGPTCDRTGTLRFTDDGVFSHIGPEIRIRLTEEDEEADGPAVISERPVCHSLDEWMTVDWDPLEDLPEKQRWQVGLLHIIRLALASVPQHLRRDDRFVLDMVDYNYQNMFIDDDCNITGFIDWDGVRAAPQGMGATRFPSWITRDWDPGCYSEPVDGNWEGGFEDPPEQLSKYRQHYAETFASLNLRQGYDPCETKVSHILEAIKLAAGSRMDRQYTAIKLLHHAFRGKVPFTAGHCYDTLTDIDSEAGKAMEKQIAEAFSSMWHAEWEAEETKASNSMSFNDIMDNLGK